jgi:hypothetical protein
MKKIVLVSMLAGSMFFNTACTDEQVNGTILGIGLAVGVAAIAADAHNHDDHNDYGDGYQDGRHDGYHNGRSDGYGNGYHDGRHDGYHGGYRGYSLQTSATKASPLALKYGISNTAAAKIEKAFGGVKTQGVASFANIGLTKGDLKDISKRELPESSSIKAVAAKLDMSEAQSRDLIKDMIREFDAQASNSASPYWKSCMAKGKWRTPQNFYCKNTAWNGCSPQTGASLCY